MTSFLEPVLAGVKLLVLVLGGTVTLLAHRAYLRTRIAGLQYFAAGLFIITIGTVLVGVLHHVVGISLTAGILLESSLICVGFVVMIVGLYGY